ncbi:MAG: DUF5668 domain-containing protein [bacterium]
MRNDRLFLGLLLIATGLSLGLQRLGLLPYFSLWELFRQLWPLLLILMGFSLFFNRSRVATVIIIFLFLVLGLGVGLAWYGVTDWSWGTPPQREEFVPRRRMRRFAIPWEEARNELMVEGELAAAISPWAAGKNN